jgi:hypothetical protein
MLQKIYHKQKLLSLSFIILHYDLFVYFEYFINMTYLE